MTVCIGVLCDDQQSVVLIADRMITTGLAIEFEHPVSSKITPLSDNCQALTAGNALAHTELFAEVRGATANSVATSAEGFVEIIKETYQKLRQKQIIERVLMPRGFSNFGEFYQAQGMGLAEGIALTIFGQIERFNYGLEILVGGISPAGGHLFAVDDPGTSHCLDSLSFYAIGSGTNLAMSSLISSQCHHRMRLVDAILVALEAKIIAENAPGVGNRTDIAVIVRRQQSPVSIWFDDEEIKELRNLCELRKEGDDAYAAKIDTMIKSKFSATGISPSADSSTMRQGDSNANSDTTQPAQQDGKSSTTVEPVSA